MKNLSTIPCLKMFTVSLILCAFTQITNAQSFSKLKDKVNKSVEKAVEKTMGTKTEADKAKEEKEAKDRSEYHVGTQNGEKPMFSVKPPANGRLFLTLQKEDRFWGGYIKLISQPDKDEKDPNILDHVKVGVGSFYGNGESASYASYQDGKRTEEKIFDNEPDIPYSPEHIYIQNPGNVKGFEYYSDPEKGCSFKFEGKTYGPYNTDASAGKLVFGQGAVLIKGLGRFYGSISYTNGRSKTPTSTNQIISPSGTLELVCGKGHLSSGVSYPEGDLCMYYYALGDPNDLKLPVTFKLSNGKIQGPVKYEVWSRYYTPFLSDNGFLVALSPLPEVRQYFDQQNTLGYYKDASTLNGVFTDGKFSNVALVDFKTELTFEVPLNRQGLLISNTPEKSVFYSNHTLYYPNGSKPKEAISNMGDVQLLHFNGREYLVWIEVIKNANGQHQVYVAQREL